MTFRLSMLAVAVAAAVVPAKAIEVTFNEDNGVRNWFNVVWGPNPTAPLAAIESGGFSDGGAVDMDAFINVDHINPIQPGSNPPDLTPFFDSFQIDFEPGFRLFSTATISGFNGTAVFAIPGELYGAQVLYGTPLPITTVPDSAATAWLLALGLLSITPLARRVKRGLCVVVSCR